MVNVTHQRVDCGAVKKPVSSDEQWNIRALFVLTRILKSRVM